MTRPLSSIHAPLMTDDVVFPEFPPEQPGPPPVPSRTVLLAQLDARLLAGRRHSLGAGGASAAFSSAVGKALIDEIAEQLREGPFEISEEDGEVRRWAKEIIAAFEEG